MRSPPGSAAAPTAGLHFTPELLAALEADGVRRASVTLHVGLDTFRPLEGEFIDEHHIHREWYEIPPETTRRLSARRGASWRSARRPCGSWRPLRERSHDRLDRPVRHAAVRFEAVDALITNFHLPRSSLLLLVTAFVQAGMGGDATPFEARDALLDAYRSALDEGYRFFSFGDAMLIV